MGIKKGFVKTDLTIPKVEQVRDPVGQNVIALEAIPPAVTMVRFPAEGNASSNRSFDFGRWYGSGADEIIYACQRQIERFLATHDGDKSAASVVSYCLNGLNAFFDYLLLRSVAEDRSLKLEDIHRNLIDGFLVFLDDGKTSAVTQSTRFQAIKAVLVALGQRGLIQIIKTGDNATFPRNAFPNIHRRRQGESPMQRGHRQAFAAAVKSAVMPIFQDGAQPTRELLSYALLTIALHTGRNTTPLLEMGPDCLRSHPKDKLEFLVVYKRRSRQNSTVILGSEKMIESMPTVFPSVARLIRRIIELTQPLREQAPGYLKQRVWLYPSQSNPRAGEIWALSPSMVGLTVKKLVKDFNLLDANGDPLRINVSRLRKTFINRINEILGDDLVATAVAAGNTPQVTGNIYLRPGEGSKKNWKFMGVALTRELLSATLGETEKTPTGGCTDTKTGQFAPKRDGATCMNFLDCVRCRNYVVTGDDLYRLFSFYWRIYSERGRMDKRKWERHYAHILRLIDRDVVQAGMQKKAFTQSEVTAARERAKIDPHPFWSSNDPLGGVKL